MTAPDAAPRLGPATALCISLAERPGRTGTALHNAGYAALGLDYAYRAFGVADIDGAIAGVRALGIRGASVSMPFKERVVALVDALDESAREVGAVNTVVNDAGRLIGYNTDAAGARMALQELGLATGSRVLLLGAGGAAKAVLTALGRLGTFQVAVAARTRSRADAIAQAGGATAIDWDARFEGTYTVLINATPIGMSPAASESPCPLENLGRFTHVMDLVASPFETRLIRDARTLGVNAMPGYRMAMHQAAAQFHLYTGYDAPLDVFERVIADLAGAAN